MFRPPFLARVAAGAAVYALEETRRLPVAAVQFPITAISRVLQTTMHVQQFVTSLALKGDAVFERLGSPAQEQPEWATFDEDLAPAATTNGHASRFDLFAEDASESQTNGRAVPASLLVLETENETVEPAEEAPEEVEAPEVAIRYDYPSMTLAQLRARLRMLSVEELGQLLAFEQQTRARAPFVTMLTNRIATVQAK
ncbi:lipid droplet-associated protein [Nocardia rosealba]|uniref:lipid droplet-associated protein n=1 Tax=Nocardia rosealba TaxID=2878563 RepID=UPI001CD9E385|nr:lipid droplet-associated protein [Nocardia rosealba]MCA2206096.1 lipid droplet-associated protein [Nocardia rosealba]